MVVIAGVTALKLVFDTSPTPLSMEIDVAPRVLHDNVVPDPPLITEGDAVKPEIVGGGAVPAEIVASLIWPMSMTQYQPYWELGLFARPIPMTVQLGSRRKRLSE